MKTNPTDRMKDPFYAGLIFQIEQMICQADAEARELDVELTDSQMKSALIKVKKLVQGGRPEVPQETKRDKVLQKLIMSLYHAPDGLREEAVLPDGSTEEAPLNIKDWIRALETVLDSMKTHKSSIPGSRDYLAFVTNFIVRARGGD